LLCVCACVACIRSTSMHLVMAACVALLHRFVAHRPHHQANKLSQQTNTHPHTHTHTHTHTHNAQTRTHHHHHHPHHHHCTGHT
jgi:hypothetical protein